ncbi:MAG: SDR family oxidoreductase [Deinococcales bacterium]
MKRLDQKIALISGAAAGIGRGIALAFAAEGAKVGVLDLDQSRCQAVVDEIKTQGGKALALAADISNPISIETALSKLKKHFGPVEILVNNAAIMPSGALHETDWQAIQRCVSVNLLGSVALSRAIIPDMLAQARGSIIHMASVTGMLGLPGLAIYSATKGALISLARAMSTDYAKKGIRVNSVSPGTIDSPMLHAFLAEQNQGKVLRKAFDEMHPIGRIGTIEEVAKVFIFLASDEASFVTGANYTVDGGLSVRGEQPQDES